MSNTATLDNYIDLLEAVIIRALEDYMEIQKNSKTKFNRMGDEERKTAVDFVEGGNLEKFETWVRKYRHYKDNRRGQALAVTMENGVRIWSYTGN